MPVHAAQIRINMLRHRDEWGKPSALSQFMSHGYKPRAGHAEDDFSCQCISGSVDGQGFQGLMKTRGMKLRVEKDGDHLIFTDILDLAHPLTPSLACSSSTFLLAHATRSGNTLAHCRRFLNRKQHRFRMRS